MPKQIENQNKGNGARRRIESAAAAVRLAALHALIAGEIAPILAARREADELRDCAGHYVPTPDVSDWPRIRGDGEATHGGEVQVTCGRGYYPAHVAHGGESRGGADMGAENEPLLAAALAVADERGAVTAMHA